MAGFHEEDDLLNSSTVNMVTRYAYLPDNVTLGDVQQDVTGASRAQLILSVPENILLLTLGSLAIILNSLSVLAISRICPSQLTSHFRLILSLALSDILIGVSLVLFLLINAFVELYPVGLGPEDKRLTSRCLYCVSKALNNTALAITQLNLLGMAIDHYIAIIRPLHYSMLLSRERSIFMIAVLWTIAALFGFSNFFSAYPKYSLPRIYERFNFCEFIHITKYNEEFAVFAMSFICLVTMLFVYIRIYVEVRKHQARTPHVSQDAVKNKKAILTTLLILGTFVICWIPNTVFSIGATATAYINPDYIIAHSSTLYKVDQALLLLLLVNAIADPVIYAARVKEVQFGYTRLFCPRSRRVGRRRRSSTSYDVSQHTTFIDLPRKSSRASNPTSFQTAFPLLKHTDIHSLIINNQ